jgi:hypothetical protein
MEDVFIMIYMESIVNHTKNVVKVLFQIVNFFHTRHLPYNQL